MPNKPVIRSATESLAIAIAVSQWTQSSAEELIYGLLGKKPNWVPPFVESVLQTHPDRVALSQLTIAVSRNTLLRQSIKRSNIKPLNLNTILKGKSIAALDWDLPEFASGAEMASQFGISSRRLHWLAGGQLPPDKRPRHYVATWIQKRHDGFRLIESPKTSLKEVQQKILRDILNLIPPHGTAHGFCKGRDIISFVQPHVKKAFCLRMDMKDFFPTVSGKRVFGIFRKAGYEPSVASLMANLCTTQTHQDVVELMRPPDQKGSYRAAQLYLPSHLPQGAPTSPALANLAAYRFDCRVNGFARSFNVSYSRYADDLLFSGDRSFSRIAKEFSITIGAIAIEEGFEINFRKTRFQNSSQRQSATGVVLNQGINLGRREFDRIKATVYNCVKHGPESQNRTGLVEFRQHLRGKIQWVQRLNPKKAERLMSMFNQIIWPDSHSR